MGILLGDMLVRYKADITDLTVKTGIARKEIASTGDVGKAAGPLLAAGFLVATAAVAGFAAVSTVMAGNFEQKVTKLYTTAGEAKNKLGMVGDGMLNMSSQVGTGALKLADAMYWIESGGLHGSAGLDALRVAAQAAKAENANLNKVSITLAASLNAYQGSGMSVAQVMNTLTASTGQGMMTFEGLAGSLASVLPAAAKFHVSLNNVTAALATMTMQGDPAAQAATHLKQMILALEAPSGRGAKALREIGLTSEQVATQMKTSLPDALKMITDAAGKKFPEGSAEYNSAIKDIAGGSKQMMGFLELTGTHMGKFAENVKTISSAVKQGGNDLMGWSDIQKTFNFRLDAAKAAVEALMIKVGTALLPVLGNLLTTVTPLIASFTKWLTEGDRLKNALNVVVGAVSAVVSGISRFVGWIQSNQTAMDGFKAVIAGVAVAIGVVLVMAFIAWATAAWAAAVATIAATWPILAIGAVVAVVVFGIIQAVRHWADIMKWFGNVFSAIGTFIHDTISKIGAWFSNLAVIFKVIAAVAIAMLLPIIVPIVAIIFAITHWGQIMTWLKDTVGSIFSAIGTFIHDKLTWIYDHNYYVKAFCDKVVAYIIAFKAAWGAIFSAIGTFTHDKLTWIGNKFTDFKNLIGNVFSAIGTFIHDRLTWIGDRITDFKNLVGDRFSALGTNIHQKITGVWNWLTGFIGGWPSQAFQWGAALIQGLINGIGSKFSALGSMVSNVAQTIAHFLGFHSSVFGVPPEGPGSKADTWMPALMKGLMGGIKEGTPALQVALHALMAPMASYPIVPSAVGVASSRAGSSTGGQTFILEVNGVQLAQVTAQATDRLVRLKLGANGRAA